MSPLRFGSRYGPVGPSEQWEQQVTGERYDATASAPTGAEGSAAAGGGPREPRAAVVPTLLDLLNADGVPEVRDLRRVIALDGPAGTGKSSVAKGVAARLGWRFVDTGATYRAVALAVLQAGVDPETPDSVADVARSARLELVTDPSTPRVLLDGRDVSAQIRGEAVTASVSAVSAVPAVRELLIAFQRRAMGTDGAVVEGRDIATVVAPDAALKVYLDARPEVRARRRASEAPATGPAATSGGTTQGDLSPPSSEAKGRPEVEDDLAQRVASSLAARDSRDSQTNPLVASRDAVEVDTSDRSLEQVIDDVLALAVERGATP